MVNASLSLLHLLPAIVFSMLFIDRSLLLTLRWQVCWRLAVTLKVNLRIFVCLDRCGVLSVVFFRGRWSGLSYPFNRPPTPSLWAYNNTLKQMAINGKNISTSQKLPATMKFNGCVVILVSWVIMIRQIFSTIRINRPHNNLRNSENYSLPTEDRLAAIGSINNSKSLRTWRHCPDNAEIS